MSLRFSIDEALEKGWITKAEAERQRALNKTGKPEIAHDGRRGRIIKPGQSQQPPPEPGSKVKPVTPKPERLFCSLDGDMPQEKLWRACVARWPTWVVDGRLAWEFAGAVPGRRFRLDIAFPSAKLACEVDGWEHHGKYLSDFKRDRLRDRLLVVEGWRVLRFYAEEIHSDSTALTEEIEKALCVGLAERVP